MSKELPIEGTAGRRRARGIFAPLQALVNAPHLLVGLIVLIWASCSLAYAALEDKGPVEGLWWGIVTGSTVGYGDFYPATTAGRGLGAVLIVSMLLLVPIAIGHVIANLVYDKESHAVAQVLEDVHGRLDRLEHMILASVTADHGAEWVAARRREYEEYDAAHVDVAEEMLAMFENKPVPTDPAPENR